MLLYMCQGATTATQNSTKKVYDVPAPPPPRSSSKPFPPLQHPALPAPVVIAHPMDVSWYIQWDGP